MIKDFHKTAIVTLDKEVSYAQLIQYIQQYASVTPSEKAAKTIIFSENREEWVYAFFSIWRNGGIAVPVDASSTVDDLAYILKDCQPVCIWTSEQCQEVASKAIENVGQDIRLERLDLSRMESASVLNTPDVQPDPKGVAVIIYTSGTTGSPKGVMLSYANLWANMAGVSEEVPIFDGHRRTLMLLPVHHILPLMGTVIVPIIKGCGIAICPSMSGPDIMATLCRGKVGIFIGVPRLWQTLYTGIKKKIDASPVTRALFNLCQKVDNPALSRFVFQSIRKKMGGHIDYCVSGGAALDPVIGKGLRTIGLEVLEGYGMSETAPIISFTRPGDVIPGCTGLPLPSVQCKIVDADGNPAAEGELLAKGPNLMVGYYNRPEETAAVIDKDGFIHTGDLARMDEKGRIYITGRSKEIIVLSNGKNVQPNEIEFKLEQFLHRVKEAAVTEDHDMLHAIIVPAEKWAHQLSDEQVKEALKKEVVGLYNKTVENYKKIMKLSVYRGALPRTKLEKLQRFKLKHLIQSAEVPKPVEANAEEALSQEYVILKNYVEGIKKVSVHATDHIETDLAFDSLDRVEMQDFIEQTFGMELKADRLTEFQNLQSIADYIAKEKTHIDESETDWHKMLTSDAVALELPSTSPLYPLHAKFLKTCMSAYNHLTISGAENIPVQGPYIIAPNHQSVIDAPLTLGGLSWEAIKNSYFYATEEHIQHPFLKFMAGRNNIVIMEKKNLKNSILKLGKVLKQGKNVVVFPEGSRTHDGQLDEFKKMFAILSKELNVPIIPVTLNGAFKALPRGTRILKPYPVEVTYHKPIYPSAEMTYDEISQLVKTTIQSCLK